MNPGLKRVWSAARSGLCVAAGLAASLGSVWAGTISGTATIRERIALPPDAVFEARLLDASAPGGPELQIAAARKPAGQSPIRFEIPFDSTQVQPGQRYIVRATVSARGQVLYSAEPPAGVRLDDADPPVQLVLVAGGGTVGGLASPPAGSVGPAPVQATALPAVLSALPARYLGNVEAGNNTQRWTLDLQADGRWQMRTEGLKWFDRSRSDESGNWAWDARQQRLVLSGGRESPRLFDVAGTGGLRVLDREGRATAAGAGEVLLRQAVAPLPGAPAVPVTPVGPAPQSSALSGMFVYLADAARLTLCADGRSLPVAMEGDFRALENAYRAARPQAGQALYIEIQGRIVQRPSAEWGRPAEATVLVDRFATIRPRESCGQPNATSPLRGTYWRLLRLNGQAVVVVDRQREPHLIFATDTLQVSGSGGCNRFSGQIEGNSDRIAMKQIAATRMACAAGMQLESAFFDALERAQRWRVTGSQMELLDNAGRVLAAFEAVALR